MKRFPSYAIAKAAGMKFGGLTRDGRLEATADEAAFMNWLVWRGFTPFEASIIFEDFRL